MPLNEDPDALSDDEYWALFEDAEPCDHAVPAEEIEAACARLDEFGDYRGDA